MCMKCGVSWNVRKVVTKGVISLLSVDEAEYWLWGQTAFPADMPTWKQIFKKLKEIL